LAEQCKLILYHHAHTVIVVILQSWLPLLRKHV